MGCRILVVAIWATRKTLPVQGQINESSIVIALLHQHYSLSNHFLLPCTIGIPESPRVEFDA